MGEIESGLEKRPMGGAWGNGFQGVKFGKRTGMSQELEDSMSYEEEDDDMMDDLNKRSDLDFLRQRMGKRSDLNFLKQRMGKRLIQRFGKRNYLSSPIDKRDASGFYRLIKRAPYRSIK